MWPYIIVVDLIARNDRCVNLLESMHDLLSISNLTIEPLHLSIIRSIPLPCDMLDMSCHWFLMSIELPLVGQMISM